MSTKHFCDRCGSEDKEPLLNEVKAGGRYYDLCAKCLAAFKAWIVSGGRDVSRSEKELPF